MSLIEFSALAYGFTDERVVADAAGALHPGNIIGLVGPNGGGKTTLLRLLVGDLQPEEGRVQRARDTRIEYVSQAAGGGDHDVLYDFVKSGRRELIELKHTVDRVAAQLADDPENAELIRRLGEAEDRFNTLGGHRWDSEVERLLSGLSFHCRDFRQTLGTLSGGQRQKACLARALLSSANCFIFDEPTNHLDLHAQAFFADYLRTFVRDRGILLVSHDRWLLDSLATHIWELDGGILHRYPGNYSKYVPLREQRREQARAAWEKQQEHIARTEEYIRRNLAGQNTKQAQGRRTILARMERLGRPQDDPQMSFVLEPALRSGEQLLVVENLAFGYRAGEGGAPPVQSAPETHVQAGPAGLSLNPPLTVARSRAGGEMVVEHLGFTMYRGERLGIVGPNGCGKTTLLKLLARRLTADRGMVAWGTNVELGVFSQDSADLVAGRDLLAELRSVESGITDSAARDYLGRFGFSGDGVYDDVGTLSGGERSRLTLAKIIRRRPNVLLLDEPTNHLDIYAREALEQFLLNYSGSTIIVAHDRALLERVCDRLVVFERDAAGLNTATFFRGAYSDWLAYLERGRAEAATAASQPASAGGRREGGAPDPGQPETLTPEDLEQLASAARTSVAGYCVKQQERAGRQAGELEDRIAEAEDRIKDLDRLINEAGTAQKYAEIERLQAELDRERGLIDETFAELEEVAARAECWGRHAALYNSSK